MNFLKDINIFWCFWHLLRWIKANLTHSKRIQEMSPRMKLLPFESPQPHDNIKDKDKNVISSRKERKEFFTSQMQWKALLNYKLPHYDLIFFITFNIVGIMFIQLLQPHTIFIFNICHHCSLKIVFTKFSGYHDHSFFHFLYAMSLPIINYARYPWGIFQSLSCWFLSIEIQVNPRLSQKPRWKDKSNLVLFPCPEVDLAWSSGSSGQGIVKVKGLVPGNLTFTPEQTGFINIILFICNVFGCNILEIVCVLFSFLPTFSHFMVALY